ncbi:MAG TPA: chemotaxis protein CheW [Candidatus Acidoferrales bacterium]|jgi:chemotaxis-related protein WspD|nr:chemotaxis protein CheW [Candidatus Acidoferrales bacterium]
MMRQFSSAAAQLLDREAPENYVREWTEIVAAKQQIVETNYKSVVVFRIGLEWLSLPTSAVKEIAERSILHRLPHRTGGILQGIGTIRGEILVCVALDVLLGLHEPSKQSPPEQQTSRERLIVCDSPMGRLAFVASDVYGVHHYLPRDLRDVPATVARASATYTAGILPWKDNQTIGCLDDQLVFYALNKGLA